VIPWMWEALDFMLLQHLIHGFLFQDQIMAYGHDIATLKCEGLPQTVRFQSGL